MKGEEFTHTTVVAPVPLGVLLSEEMPKADMSASVPTSAYWTGEPDEANRDPDA